MTTVAMPSTGEVQPILRAIQVAEMTPGGDMETPSWLRRAESKLEAPQRSPLTNLPTPNTMFRMMSAMQAQMEQMQKRTTVMEALAGIAMDGPAIGSATQIQCYWRRSLAVRSLRDARRSATLVQSIFCGRRDRKSFHQHLSAAIALEAYARRKLSTAALTKARRYAVRLQAAGRRRAARCTLARSRGAAVCLQAGARSRSQHRAFRRQIEAAMLLQVSIRCYRARVLCNVRLSKTALILRNVNVRTQHEKN